MKKKMVDLIDKYMYDIMGDQKEKVAERYYTYGYLDGYFKEGYYMRQFLKDVSVHYKDDYKRGFLDGFEYRLNRPFKKVELDKEEWFKKLAIHDAICNIKRYPFDGDDDYVTYNKYKNETKDVILRGEQFDVSDVSKSSTK